MESHAKTERRPRVLVCTIDPRVEGGVAHYYKALRPHLPAEVEYLYCGSRYGSERALTSLLRLSGDYLRFTRRLLSGGHDLVHLNPSLDPKSLYRDGVFLVLARILGRPVVVFFRGWRATTQARIEKAFLWFFRAVFFRATAIVVLASEFESVLARWGYRKRMFVETTTVDDATLADATAREASRETAGPRALNILFLSRVEESKGIYLALDAFKLLKQRRVDATMTVAGDGSELGRARAYAARKGIAGVRFPGYLRDGAKADAFQEADIFLFPTSHGEGMPNSVLEAMAFGLPVVTRPVGGLRDFFEPQSMGFLSESLDARTFAEALEDLAGDEERRASIGSYNRRYAAKRFAASRVAQRLQQIYALCAAGS